MQKVVLVDANVVLRFLLGDEPRQSVEATELLTQAPKGSLQLSSLTFAEVTWVLLSHYKVPREAVAVALQRVLSLPSITTDSVTLDAVARFAATTFDFADCVLAAQASDSQTLAVSFDRDLRHFSDVTTALPRAALRSLER